MTKPKHATPEELALWREKDIQRKRDARAKKKPAKTLADLKRERDAARDEVHRVDRECQREARLAACNDPGPGTWRDKYRAEWARQLPRLKAARAKRDAAIKAFNEALEAGRVAQKTAREQA